MSKAATTAGSVTISISAIVSPTMWKAKAARARPPATHAAPGVPSMRADLAAVARPTRAGHASCSTDLGREERRPPVAVGGGHLDRRAVGAEHGIGVEKGDERFVVPLPGGGQERVDDLLLAPPVPGGDLVGALHAPSSPAGELAGGRRRAPDDRGDVVEGHGEEVVEHEGEALGGSEGIEHDQEGWAHGLGEDCLLLWGEALGCRAFCLDRFFTPGAAGPEHPQAYSGDDRGEPPAEVVDALGVGTAQADPGLLHSVLSLGQRSEHPVGHGLEPWPVCFEGGGEVVVHLTSLTRRAARM